MRNLLSVVLLFVATLTLSSCCMCRKASSSALNLVGPTWSLVEYQGRPFETQDNYKIIFSDDNTASGVADCNSFMSDYSADLYNKIKVENKALTRAMCMDDRMEQAFLELLQSADSFSIDGDRLLWLRDGEQIAVFEAAE